MENHTLGKYKNQNCSRQIGCKFGCKKGRVSRLFHKKKLLIRKGQKNRENNETKQRKIKASNIVV